MSVEALARLGGPVTRYHSPCRFSSEPLAKVTLLRIVNYAELTKPGGEAERIAERYGGGGFDGRGDEGVL